MLTRFRVQGFKSLLDVELELAPLVVLMGPNAAGKSNLLEALLLLSRLATEQTLSAALAPPLRGYPLEAFSLPEGGLEALLQQKRADLTLEADLQPQPYRVAISGRDPITRRPEPLRYRVAVRMQPKTGELKIADEYLARLKRDRSINLKQTPRIELAGKTLLVRKVGEAGRPRQENVGLNHTLVSNRQFAGNQHYPDFDHLRRELSAWRTYYLDPRDAMREPQPPREVTEIGSRGEWIAPFLFRLKVSETHSKAFRAIGRALRSAIPTVDSLDVDLDPRRGTLDIVIRQDGTPYSSRVLSEGTLRVLALCCLAANPWRSELIAFEEPENGVHPRRIEVIADLLASMAAERKRQVVVTTHSPTLIAAMLQKARETPGHIKLFRCSQLGRATQVEPFQVTSPVFDDPEIRKSLSGPEDVVEAMLRRGWLDG